MAYKCELWCDFCGDAVISYLNETVSKTKMEQIARNAGWKTYRRGWMCPDCIEKLKYNIEKELK